MRKCHDLVNNSLFSYFIFILVILYNTSVGTVFYYYILQEDYTKNCTSLINWNTALIFYHYISGSFSLITLLLQIFKKEYISQIPLFMIRISLICISEITIFIGININVLTKYLDNNLILFCGDSISRLNVIYLILEWSLLIIIISITIILCICTLKIKRYSKINSKE